MDTLLWDKAVITHGNLPFAFKSRIDQASAAISRLPLVPHATAEMASAADEAVRLSTQAGDQECGKVGDNCRARVSDLKTATEARTTVLANRAVFEKREGYEAEIRKAQAELDALGVIPEQVDPAAARIGAVLAKIPFLDMGDRPDLVVVEWWPTWVAVVFEVIGLIMPRIILTATTPSAPVQRRRSWREALARWTRRQDSSKALEVTGATPALSTTRAAPAKCAATAGKSKKASKIKPAAVGDAESVRQWHKSRTVTRQGSEIKPKETYEGHYLPWCAEMKIEPVSFTKFGTTMKAAPEAGGCGVIYVEHNKRGAYVNIAVVGSPKLVAVEPLARVAAGTTA